MDNINIDPMTRREPTMPKPMQPITQAQLAEYAQVCAEHAKVGRRRKELRAVLLAQYCEGAVIETGPLALDITERDFRSLSHSSLTAIFGFQWLEKVLAAIPATVQYVVAVVESKPTSKLAKAKVAPGVDFSRTIGLNK
jgi:hypothetical protein